MKNSLCRKLSYAVIAVAMIFSLLVAPATTFAVEQEDVTVESLFLSVRPEYDYPPGWVDSEIPAVLVIHIADLVNNTEEPITTFSYPAPIDEPYFTTFAVGKLQSQGQYWPAPHVLSEGQLLIDLRDYPILPNEDYQLTVQYYYHPFTIEGDRKSFEFEFAPNFIIDEVTTNLQLPPAGRNPRVEPATYALQNVVNTNVSIDNPISLEIAYDKADNRPTTQGINQGGQGTGSSADSMLWGFIALLVIIAFVFFLVLNSKPKASSQDRKTKNRKQRDQQPSQGKKQSRNNEAIEIKKTSQEKESGKITPKQVERTNKSVKSPSKAQSISGTEEQKELRKKLVAGEIDEKTYRLEMEKITKS